ncbi:hypothetical protein KFK09_028555 [Dendrobium nobile]|uniref:Ribosome biogenesis protein slx9-like n=1 Tax=Dendrobium nobile TaxID=94219 RepID=A0A8T3A2Y4_DENNO|nr:hypothetical protein KFK09_028555 [Dendrobium nobile]
MGLTGLRRSSHKDDLSKSSKRKIEKKLNFITSKLKKRLRSRQKKLKAYDLSVLSYILPNESLKKPSRSANFKVNCKNRQKLVQKESELLRFVHSHPAFQADPISAIQQHLEQTQPPPPVEARRSNKSKKEKRKRSKKSASVQNMEMMY